MSFFFWYANSKKGASESRDGPGWKEQAANAQPRGSKGDSESNVGPSTSRVNASGMLPMQINQNLVHFTGNAIYVYVF